MDGQRSEHMIMDEGLRIFEIPDVDLSDIDYIGSAFDVKRNRIKERQDRWGNGDKWCIWKTSNDRWCICPPIESVSSSVRELQFCLTGKQALALFNAGSRMFESRKRSQ